MNVQWQLVGGKWDGLIITPSPLSVQHRAVLQSDCELHGEAGCECDDSMWYMYTDDRTRACYFVELSSSPLDRALREEGLL